MLDDGITALSSLSRPISDAIHASMLPAYRSLRICGNCFVSASSSPHLVREIANWPRWNVNCRPSTESNSPIMVQRVVEPIAIRSLDQSIDLGQR